jgi:hypothetical protein
MHSTIMDPTVGTFGGSIVEPIGVRTMDIHITMGDIIDPIHGGYYNPYTYGGYYRPYSYGGYYRPY